LLEENHVTTSSIKEAVRRVDELCASEKYEEARVEAQILLDRVEKEYGHDSLELLGVLRVMGRATHAGQVGNHSGLEACLELGRRAVQIASERLPPGDVGHVQLRERVGNILTRRTEPPKRSRS
jgi:hypothetical protein